MTIMKERPHKTGYIDAFAGTGYIHEDQDQERPPLFPVVQDEERNFLKGSARTALEIDHPFDKYVFIEKDERAYESLLGLKDEYPYRKIDCHHGDANDWLIERCSRNWESHRAVVFLDPFGMQVPWTTIQAIAETEAIDLWILFPLGIGANRLLTRDGERMPGSWSNKLTEVFGTDEWRNQFYETTKTFFGEREEKVVNLTGIGEYYVDRLKKEFAEVAPNPRPLYNSRQNPMYLLCFAAANPHASDTAVKIAQHILNP
jgi:three-Cys-motif partner protein